MGAGTCDVAVRRLGHLALGQLRSRGCWLLKIATTVVDSPKVTEGGATAEPRLGLSADRASVVLAAFLALAAVLLGVRTGYRTADVDEVVFHDTLVSMADGQGYYPAMREALVTKEGAPPTQIRSIRPPTLYLVLARFPPASWRYLVGAVYLAVLLLAWQLGRPLHPAGGPISVVLAGMWLLAASPVLYLHTELWGLPLLMAGALAFRRRRWALAAGAVAAAALLREIYVIPLIIGLVAAPRRRPWWIAVAIVGALGLAHAGLARDVLAESGKEAPFGASGLSLRYILSALSPSSQPVGWLLGAAGGILGMVGLRSRWDDDLAARLLLPFAAVMVPLTVFIGREYWSLAFGPAVACFAPAGLAAWERYRSRPSTGARNLPV